MNDQYTSWILGPQLYTHTLYGYVCVRDREWEEEKERKRERDKESEREKENGNLNFPPRKIKSSCVILP